MAPVFPNPHHDPHQQSNPVVVPHIRPMPRNPSYINPSNATLPGIQQPYQAHSAQPLNSPQPRMSMPAQHSYAMPSSRPPSGESSRRSSAQGALYSGSYIPQNGRIDHRTGQQMSGAAQRPHSRPSMHTQSGSAPAFHHQASVPAASAYNNSTPQPIESSSQGNHLSSNAGHSPDDCPGCLADYHAAVRASEASAMEETRLREQRQREDEEHWRAVQASEEEHKRQRETEEAEMRQVMEASRMEEEAAARKRQEKQREEEEHRRVLLEESRQSALREDEERIRKAHAELFERSKREAEEVTRRRREEEERMQAMEIAAVEESRREMEQEWRRRDEEERALEEFAQRGGKQGEAAYWQHVSDSQAYDLAVEMNRTLSFGNEGTSSSRLSRRPLPPTPGLAALAAGIEGAAKVGLNDEQDQESSDGEDPFGDQAEALPSYDEVRSDRPPEAPQDIPNHIRFASPVRASSTAHSNTLILPSRQSEKAAVSHNQDSRLSRHEVPSSSINSIASGSMLPPATISLEQSFKPEETVLPSTPVAENGQGHEALSTITPPSIVISRASTRSTVASSRSTREQQQMPIVLEQPSSPVEASRKNSIQQRAMKGTDFGYSSEPFSSHLKLEDGEEDKRCFPSAIQIRATRSDGSLRERQAFFTIKAHSWKMLLRALAWYGNTRVEAGAEEVVDSLTPLKVRVEVEFVTPTKVDVAGGPTSVQEAYKNAHVAVCMSLIGSKTLKTSDASLTTSLKQSSRSLDASYLRRGSTRRVITLPSQAPILPMTIVRLAQHLHQAHIFSSACPSTSHTALHSPRDLTQAIERHDYNYMAKLKKKQKEIDKVEAAVPTSNEQGMSQTAADDDDDDDGVPDPQVVEAFGEGDSTSAGRMSRVKAKVMRKLGGRYGEGSNQDLESWITPFDVNQHG